MVSDEGEWSDSRPDRFASGESAGSFLSIDWSHSGGVDAVTGIESNRDSWLVKPVVKLQGVSRALVLTIRKAPQIYERQGIRKVINKENCNIAVNL